MTLKPPQETTIRTNAELTQLWHDMIGVDGFGLRSLWHIFIEPSGQLRPVVLPIDDIPLEPDPKLVSNLAYVLGEVVVETPSTIAVLLSRPGPGQMSDSDRQWARAIRHGYGPELSPWPIHLATHGRVQVFAPDDLIAA